MGEPLREGRDEPAGRSGGPTLNASRVVGRVRPAARTARPVAELLLCGLVAGLVVLLTPGSAAAHAALVSSEPKEGSTLPTSPPRVSMDFGEPVEPIVGGAKIFGPDGLRKDSRDPKIERKKRLTISLPPGMPPGTYTVTYRVASADSHPTSGAFTFHVGRASATKPAVPAGALSSGAGGALLSLLLGALRWLAFLGLALLVGPVVAVLVCWTPGAGGPTVARRMVTFGGGLLAAGTVGQLLLFSPYVTGQSLGTAFDPGALGDTLGTRFGSAMLARLLMLAVLAGVLRRLLGPGTVGRSTAADPARPSGAFTTVLDRLPGRLRPRPSARRGALAGPASRAGTSLQALKFPLSREDTILLVPAGMMVVGITLTWGFTGHTSAGPQVGLAISMDLLHVLAMAVWVGGVALLVATLLPGETESRMRAVVLRFSRVAGVCVAVLTVTGVYQAWRLLGGLSGFTDGNYGRVLLAKIGVFIGLIGLATVARTVVRERDDPTGARLLRRLVAFEASFVVVILALVAVLVNLQPARNARTARAAARIPSDRFVVTLPYDTGGTTARKGTVRLTVTPAKAGPVNLLVIVTDQRDHRVGALIRMTFFEEKRGIGPLQAELVRDDLGIYTMRHFQIPVPGTYKVELFARVSSVAESRLVTYLTIR